MSHLKEIVHFVVEVLKAVGADFETQPVLSLVLIGMLLAFCAFALHLTHGLVLTILLAAFGVNGS
jgi:hypothetical protein